MRQPMPNMKYKYYTPVPNTKYKDTQMQNTKIEQCNQAIIANFYRPMPNTKYKSANHYQIQNTIIRNILSWAASEIASTRSACLNSRSEEWCLLKQKLEAVMTSHKSWFISAWNHSRDARVTPGTRPCTKESTISKDELGKNMKKMKILICSIFEFNLGVQKKSLLWYYYHSWNVPQWNTY